MSIGNSSCTKRDMRYKVKFTVQFEVEVECKPEELYGMVGELNIPEDGETKYVSDTFEVDSIHNDKGEIVKLFQE